MMDDLFSPASSTWRVIKRHAEDRRTALRLRLEAIGLEHDETEAIRARIDELGQLLGLADPKPDIPQPVIDKTAGY